MHKTLNKVDSGTHDKPQHQKMAHGASVVTISMQTCAGTYQSCKTTPERRKMAHTRQRPSAIKPSYNIQLKHTLLLLGGTPFQHFGNTTLFWLLTTQPSNLRIQHCNRMVQRWFQLAHTHLPVDQGSPCREPCNTTPFSAHSIQPANSRIHQHNCTGPPGRVALLASLVAILVEVAVLWVGIHGGALCSTTISSQLPRYFRHPQRN